MKRKLVLQSCMNNVSWGLLEMSILLTDDIVDFDMLFWVWDLDSECNQFLPDIDIKLKNYEHQDLIIPLLIAKCPESIFI